MDFWRSILAALPNAASTPLAFAAYVFVLIAWLVLAIRVKRNKQLLASLEKLPESDRIKALELEMGAVRVRSGLSANQWLRSRVQLYYFLGFCLLCVLAVVVFAIAMAKPGTDPHGALNESRITGEWYAILRDADYAPQGNQFFFKLKANSGKLFGTVIRVYNLNSGETKGYPHGISDGKIEGDKLSFWYVGETKHQDGEGHYTDLKDLFYGAVSGDAIHFTYQVEGESPVEFTAKRVAEASPGAGSHPK
jgi:hypothetical protein